MYVILADMNPITRIPTPIRWILLGLSFPIAGLIVWLALGPVTNPGLALAGGAVAGIVIGAAESFALRLPLARWALATGTGLAIGSLLAALVSPLLGDGILGTIVTALIAGAATAAVQLIAGPPLARPLWLVLRSVAWVVGWVVSLVLAINVTQGFIVFGSTGALVFTVGMFFAVRLLSRRAARAGAAVTA
jgi:hypothetical protein